MRTVIYDAEDMEPITVIDVPRQFMKEIESGKRDPILHFAVMPPLSSAASFNPTEPPPIQEYRRFYFTIRFEPIWKGRKRLMWLATTMDGETALLARSIFLPGQQAAVEQERRAAFMRGIMAAMTGPFA